MSHEDAAAIANNLWWIALWLFCLLVFKDMGGKK